MLNHYKYTYERLIGVFFPACSHHFGKKIEQTFTVIDLDGFSLSLMGKQIYEFLKLAGSIASDNYPEVMGETLIVNSPFVFSGVWSIVKTFIDEKTRNKFKILKRDY